MVLHKLSGLGLDIFGELRVKFLAGHAQHGFYVVRGRLAFAEPSQQLDQLPEAPFLGYELADQARLKVGNLDLFGITRPDEALVEIGHGEELLLFDGLDDIG